MSILRRSLRTIPLLAVLSVPLAAQQPATFFRNARVFDGTRVLERTDVLAEGGRITRVGRGVQAPAGAAVVDATGKTLLPGLIDAHSHSLGDALREAAVFGVTTSLDMFSISGTITTTIPQPWYGAMWSPGAQPMAPVDLSARQGLAFQARGDGKTYRVMVFARSKGMTPQIRTFTAGPEWREVSFSWSDFGVDGRDVIGVVIAAGPQPGPFAFMIDGVRLR